MSNILQQFQYTPITYELCMIIDYTIIINKLLQLLSYAINIQFVQYIYVFYDHLF